MGIKTPPAFQCLVVYSVPVICAPSAMLSSSLLHFLSDGISLSFFPVLKQSGVNICFSLLSIIKMVPFGNLSTSLGELSSLIFIFSIVPMPPFHSPDQIFLTAAPLSYSGKQYYTLLESYFSPGILFPLPLLVILLSFGTLLLLSVENLNRLAMQKDASTYTPHPFLLPLSVIALCFSANKYLLPKMWLPGDGYG